MFKKSLLMPIALFFLSFNASAITDAERDELSRLKELNAIKQGVEDSLNMIRREPKVQTNVTGEY
jgi:hypothetical protein